MEGLWPANFEKSEEENGRGRHWTDHEDCGWKAGSNGFKTVADRMVEKLGLDNKQAPSLLPKPRTALPLLPTDPLLELPPYTHPSQQEEQ